ncbi:tRNA pseudouridine38-40 synthase [Pontimonas salivibrio]|uniref:tRNA pseudouridine synthase A n=1 Tax=Pontimonas salivibrio TaxID=1159327 RepID=A0A2L2BNW7_9MICO|nr:tRNA pseudouridine38-40 synthase [Pontimonas salivibrio]
MSIRLRIDLSYDGSDFSGWAIQPHRRTVQGDIELALSRVFHSELQQVRTVVAGRTDAGVHATGQVCHADLPDEAQAVLNRAGGDEHILRRLRGALGKTSPIWIQSVGRAPAGFDARFSALSRRYEYRMADADSTKDPRRVDHTLWVEDLLDIGEMNTLGDTLRGVADWASFCRARPGATTIRELQQFSWKRDADNVLVATVIADAFCHSMVRSLVGAAVAVGRADLSVEQIVALRDATTRTSSWKTMAAKGLTLCEVKYPPDDELFTRAEATRSKREQPTD